MRGHVTAASIKTNLYCKETPLALFVCHEPRVFPWNLCWALGQSLYPRGPPGQVGAGWEGALAGPYCECWVRMPLILSWLPSVCLGAALASLGAGAVPLGAGAGVPWLPEQDRGLGCAGSGALGWQGQAASRSLAAPEATQWVEGPFTYSVPQGHQDSGCIHLVLRPGLLSSVGLMVATCTCKHIAAEITAPLWVSLFKACLWWELVTIPGDLGRWSVILGHFSGWACTGTSCLFWPSLTWNASCGLSLCVVFAWELSAAVWGLTSECQSQMNRTQAPHYFLLSWLEGDLQLLHIFVMFPILSSLQLFWTPSLRCSTKSSQWFPTVLSPVSVKALESIW